MTCWEQIISLLTFVVNVKFTWSVRQFNFVTTLIGSIAPRDEVSELDKSAARRAGGILKLAGENFGQGMRAYYFAVAAMFWFVQPLFFVAATIIVTVMLYRMEFHSRTLDVLSGDV